eukprot:TRINITY_DN1924_c0_g2_i2.p1 TRINITY_DN1924_c0_g2~~TRINITY_DN1924_c0_g2_i2.p1  ORF type:complete len:923 (-),score=21.78 TRINITY_DN1924_c0_g2_i2:61-2700(-)
MAEHTAETLGAAELLQQPQQPAPMPASEAPQAPCDPRMDESPPRSSPTLSSPMSTSQREHVEIDLETGAFGGGESVDAGSIDSSALLEADAAAAAAAQGPTSVLRFRNISYTVTTRRQKGGVDDVSPDDSMASITPQQSGRLAATGSLSGRVSSMGSSVSRTLSEMRKTGSRTILADINGCARSGEITAIMGASGSGKTTLLNIVGHRIAAGKRSGTVELDGTVVRGSQMQRLSAYVMQDDLMYPSLTVRETLMFSAELRLPQSVSRKEKEAKVERLLELLGLLKVGDSLIGDEDRRGVSGGERKRVAIGVEIVCDPRILFLDEPTSGLDSTSAFRVVRAIRDIAAATGSITLMVIHQPSFRVMGLIDRLIMLACGHTIFQGPPPELPVFLESFGCPVPQFANSTEFALDLIEELQQSTRGVADLVAFSSKHQQQRLFLEEKQEEEERSKRQQQGNRLADVPRNSSLTVSLAAAGVNDSSNSTAPFLNEPSSAIVPSVPPAFAAASSLEVATANSAATASPPHSKWTLPFIGRRASKAPSDAASTDGCSSGIMDKPRPRYGNSWLRELFILSKRSAMIIMRTPALYLLRLALIGITGLLLATLFYNPEESLKGFQQILAFFVFVNCVLFFCSCDAVPLFIQDRNIFIRETSSNAYRPSTYMISSTVVYLPLHFLMALILVLENFWALNLSGGAGGFVFLLMTCFAMLFAGNSIAIIVSVLVNHVVLAYAVSLSLMAYFVLLSGFYIDRLSIPPMWIWLHYISPMKYAYEAFVQNEFGRPYGPCYLVAGNMFGNTPLQPYVNSTLVDKAFLGMRSLLQGTPYSNITSETCLQDGPQLLTNVVVVDNLSMWGDVLVLLVFGLLIRFVTFLLLVRLRASKQG